MTSQRFVLTADQRDKVISILKELTDEQLAELLKNSLSIHSNMNSFRQFNRSDLMHEAINLIDQHFTTDLGHAIQFLRQQTRSTNEMLRARTSIKILHKILPFHRHLGCVHQRYSIFKFNHEKNQYFYRDEFLLSFDVANQLAMSYDLHPETNLSEPTKFLILRLVRLDRPPSPNGRFDDDLPPNLSVFINGKTLTCLPPVKSSTTVQTNVIRAGREIDITSLCMFNPILKNRLELVWAFPKDDLALQTSYHQAQYAAHIFLVERRTIDELQKYIVDKVAKFTEKDFCEFLRRIYRNTDDGDDDVIQISEQIIKIVCPIDLRRIKVPVRAINCQHLQCFDLKNYLVLNEKVHKWICPVCNKNALFEDLQVDMCTQTMIETIKDRRITDIVIDGNFRWTPIVPIDENREKVSSLSTNENDDIMLIDD